MTRTRTTPEEYASIAKDAVIFYGVEIPVEADGSPATDAIKFHFEVQHMEADGSKIAKYERIVTPIADWPASLKTDVKALYQRVLGYAEAQGYIGAGTDEDPMP